METCPLCGKKLVNEEFIICVDNENDPGAGTLEIKYGCTRLPCPLYIKNSMFTLENLDFIKEFFNKSNERSRHVLLSNEKIEELQLQISEYQKEILDSKKKTLEYIDLLAESYKQSIIDKDKIVELSNKLVVLYNEDIVINNQKIKQIDKEISFYKYSSYIVLFILIIIFIASFFI